MSPLKLIKDFSNNNINFIGLKIIVRKIRHTVTLRPVAQAWYCPAPSIRPLFNRRKRSWVATDISLFITLKASGTTRYRVEVSVRCCDLDRGYIYPLVPPVQLCRQLSCLGVHHFSILGPSIEGRDVNFGAITSLNPFLLSLYLGG